MDMTNELLARFEQLHEIGAALSSERNIDRLLEHILLAAKTITHADGGTLYRVADNQKFLRFEIVRTDSLNIAFGGTTGAPIPANFKDLPLYRDDGQPNNSLVAAYAAIHAETVNIADAYAADGFDFSGTRKFDAVTGYRSQSFLTVPMKNHANEIIGVLQLINAMDPQDGAVRVFSDADRRLVESLASQAAVALTNRLLVSQLEELFVAFIRSIEDDFITRNSIPKCFIVFKTRNNFSPRTFLMKNLTNSIHVVGFIRPGKLNFWVTCFKYAGCILIITANLFFGNYE